VLVYNHEAVDLNTRQLRYFVVVAEELHFTRAAARLFVAQQSLSAQIRQLEQRVGATLLRRTTRRVELTPAGELFLTEAREMLAALDRGIASARESENAPASTLSVGFMLSAALELTAPILTEFGRRHPHVRVGLHEYLYNDPSVGLASGAVDIGFVHLPITLSEARCERLFVQPRAVCVSTSHPLASHDSLSVADVLDEAVSAPRCLDPAWSSFWTLDEYRGGRAANIVAYPASLAEELEAVALGQYVMFTASGAARFAPRPGVRIIPIHDIVGSEMAIVWQAERETDVVRAFVTTALDVRHREVELVARIEHG
jgi:DNA-binding transcriptional LysR family regulator